MELGYKFTTAKPDKKIERAIYSLRQEARYVSLLALRVQELPILNQGRRGKFALRHLPA